METLASHIPDGNAGLPRALQSDALRDAVDRHQANLIHPDRFNPICGIGWKRTLDKVGRAISAG